MYFGAFTLFATAMDAISDQLEQLGVGRADADRVGRRLDAERIKLAERLRTFETPASNSARRDLTS
jgi:hypothetical protein